MDGRWEKGHSLSATATLVITTHHWSTTYHGSTIHHGSTTHHWSSSVQHEQQPLQSLSRWCPHQHHALSFSLAEHKHTRVVRNSSLNWSQHGYLQLPCDHLVSDSTLTTYFIKYYQATSHYYTHAAYCYRWGSVVCRSVCQSQLWALQQRLNWLRCSLGRPVQFVQRTCISWGWRSPHGNQDFLGAWTIQSSVKHRIFGVG